MDVQATHAHGIWRIAHLPMPSFGSKRKWECLPSPLAPWGLECGPQNGNVGNWLVLQSIFTSLSSTSALSWMSDTALPISRYHSLGVSIDCWTFVDPDLLEVPFSYKPSSSSRFYENKWRTDSGRGNYWFFSYGVISSSSPISGGLPYQSYNLQNLYQQNINLFSFFLPTIYISVYQMLLHQAYKLFFQ